MGIKWEEFLEEQKHITTKRKPRHIESQIQQACVQWFRVTYPQYIILSIPNGGSRNSIEAFHLKQEGALAGASDLLIIAAAKVLFVEIKTAKGRQQDTQKAFQQKVQRLKHPYVICRSLDSFIETINNWLENG